MVLLHRIALCVFYVVGALAYSVHVSSAKAAELDKATVDAAEHGTSCSPCLLAVHYAQRKHSKSPIGYLALRDRAHVVNNADNASKLVLNEIGQIMTLGRQIGAMAATAKVGYGNLGHHAPRESAWQKWYANGKEMKLHNSTFTVGTGGNAVFCMAVRGGWREVFGQYTVKAPSALNCKHVKLHIHSVSYQSIDASSSAFSNPKDPVGNVEVSEDMSSFYGGSPSGYTVALAPAQVIEKEL